METKRSNISARGASVLVFSCLILSSFSFFNLGGIERTLPTIADERPSIAPVNLAKAKIGDGFGYRIHPATKEYKMHNGIDFIVPEGESVVATADGVVVDVGNDKHRGSYITIKHNEIYTTSYFHLKSAVVKVRNSVKKKQVIGYVGSTGISSSEAHLHYEVLKGGQNVNPVDYLPESVAAKLQSNEP